MHSQHGRDVEDFRAHGPSCSEGSANVAGLRHREALDYRDQHGMSSRERPVQFRAAGVGAAGPRKLHDYYRWGTGTVMEPMRPDSRSPTTSRSVARPGVGLGRATLRMCFVFRNAR